MKTYTRLHCFFHRGDIHKTVIETGHPKQKNFKFLIYTRLSLKQVNQNKKFQTLQSLRRVSNAWNSLLKNVTKIESN